MSRELDVKILVESYRAKQELAAVESQFKATGKAAEQAGSDTGGIGTFEKKLLKVGQAIGGMAALDKAADNVMRFSTASVTAFGEQEAASKRLETALKAQGVAVPETMALYNQLATQYQNTTVFQDDLITSMQALLVQVGGVMPEQMGAALQAATNLSAGLGIDLETATRAVAKAFEGGGSALTRLLPSLKDLIKDGASSAEVLDAINTRFGDAAQAQMETYQGKVARLSNQWNDFQEKIGAALITVLDPLLTWFLNLPDAIQNVLMGIGGLTAVLAPLATGIELIARLFGTSLIPLLARALPAAIGGLEVLLGPAGWFIAAIIAIYVAWKNWDTIGPMVQRIYQQVKSWLVDRFRAVVDSIKGLVGDVTGFFKDMYDKVVGNSYVPDMVRGIGREFGKLDGDMVAPARRGTDAVSGLFGSMGSAVSGHITSLIGDSLGKFGQAFGVDGILSGLIRDGMNSIFGPSGVMRPIIEAGLSAIKGVVGGFISWVGSAIVGAVSSMASAVLPILAALGPVGALAAGIIYGIIGGHRDPPPPPGQVMNPNDPGVGIPSGPAPPGTEVPNMPAFALGGYMPHTGAAWLHEGEGVLNPRAMARLGRSGLDALNRGGSGGGTTVNVYVDGDLNSSMARRKVAMQVKGVLDDDYRLRRKVSAR